MSHSRARSEEAKRKQIEHIIETAKDLFHTKGTSGFNMRSLAKKLDMSQGNLYNYWTSKRELWYDIVKRDFHEFEEGMYDLIRKHQGSYVSLFVNLADYYFTFAKNNPQKYRMMFVIPPPIAEKVGTEEKTFKPNTIAILLKIVQEAVVNGELKINDVEKFTLYLWSVVHGAVLISTTIVFDPDSGIAIFGTVEEFLEYVKFQVLEQMQSFS